MIVSRDRWRMALWLSACGVLCAMPLLPGCKSTPKAVPTVAALNVAGMDSAALERGRRIYLTDCARCHAPEPIGKYSIAEWHEIMPPMIELTKLDAQAAHDVNLYVMTARRTLPASE